MITDESTSIAAIGKFKALFQIIHVKRIQIHNQTRIYPCLFVFSLVTPVEGSSEMRKESMKFRRPFDGNALILIPETKISGFKKHHLLTYNDRFD